MCCCVPLVKWVRSNMDPDEGLLCSFIITEIIRWIVVAIPIFLSAWRYGELVEYYQFIPGMDKKLQYWIVTSCIFLAGSLLLYFPIKIICIKFWRRARHDYGWRPSIVIYILMCALPCLATVLFSILKWRAKEMENPDRKFLAMDESSTSVVQAVVMGLTITEWMSKFRDEEMTFDLINAMATDFFFAYDVIDFFMLSAYEENIFKTYWLPVTFVLGFIAMFKYIPAQPTEMNENGTPKGAVTCIIVSMLVNDIPFVVVRFTTMGMYGLKVSDIIHPAKNVAMILFGCTQLYIIHHNHRLKEEKEEEKERVSKFSERRCTRKRCRDNVDADQGNAGDNRLSGYTNEDCYCEEEEEETDLARQDMNIKEIKVSPPAKKTSVKGP